MASVRSQAVAKLSGLGAIYVLTNLLVSVLGLALFFKSRSDIAASAKPGLMEPLSISIMAAGVVGLVSFGYVVLSERTRSRILVLQEFGVEDYFDTNATSLKGVYKEHFSNDAKSIDVLGTGLNKLRRDFFEDLTRWATNKRVRVLLLHPDFPDADLSCANQRDFEEKDSGGTIRSNVNAWKEWHQAQLSTGLQGKIAIRLYRCLPTLTMVRVDAKVFWAPYLMYTPAGSAPTMLVRRGGHLYDTLSRHFDAIWDDRELSVPIEEYV